MRGALRRPRTTGGTWSYRIDLGVGADGRRRQRQQGGFRTKREAQTALNEALGELQRGEFVSPSKQTLAEFTEAWLAAVKGELAESAWANYGALMRTYVLPRVGAVRLVDLTPQRVQALYVELLERGKKDGSPLSARSVLQVHRTLHRALGDAVRWRLLARNPAHGVRPPRAEKKEMTAWSASDARAFLAGTANDRLATLWVVALNSGMRRGELAGLRWADVDLDGGNIAVTQQRTTARYKVVVAEPKARSRRVIPVDPAVVESLRAHRRRQLEERLLVGAAWTDSGYVFVDELGVPYHPERLGELFGRSCRAVGVPPIRLHDLRHTMATAALQAGIHPKVVQERLGHSSIAITLDTYSHVAPTLQREAADKLGQLFSP